MVRSALSSQGVTAGNSLQEARLSRLHVGIRGVWLFLAAERVGWLRSRGGDMQIARADAERDGWDGNGTRSCSWLRLSGLRNNGGWDGVGWNGNGGNGRPWFWDGFHMALALHPGTERLNLTARLVRLAGLQNGEYQIRNY